MQDLSGQKIKGYELRELIGTGGFAWVYRAFQPLVEREVAIKIIQPDYANHPDFIRRFELEAQLVARLEHLHIVPLYDFWREPDGAYLIMRWLRGGSLRALLNKRRPDLTFIVRIMQQVGTALAAAHRKRIIHRDLKPDNVLLDEEGNAYLADFGIAQDLFGNWEDMRFQAVGSPAYVSPEQATGKPVLQQADIYSLGIVLFELLTGRVPYVDSSVTMQIEKHVSAPIPLLQSVRPDLPAEINRVIQRALAKEPSLRYPDVLSFISDFVETVKSGDGMTVTVTETPNEGQSSGVNPTRVITQQKTEEPTHQTIVFRSDIENPFKGLRSFEEADSDDFFGREKQVKKLLERISSPALTERFLAVVGPSGSGKSSVVKAGLIAALRRGEVQESAGWFIRVMTPGTHPLTELENVLLSIATSADYDLHDTLYNQPDGLAQILEHILPNPELTMMLVIDQFEELFTLVEDETTRTHFLYLLVNAVHTLGYRFCLVITLRADYYDRPLLYPEFGALVRDHTEVILPLVEDELHEAIVKPLEKAGIMVDSMLVERLIEDVREQPGALPLLQYALTELFDRRDGLVLPLEAYQKNEGVLGALTRRADELYQLLDKTGQEVVQQIFLRLIAVGEGNEPTRRRVLRNELISLAGVEKSIADKVIDLFGKFRLLTFDHDPVTRLPTVEVAHEALLRQWGRLREWLEGSRDALRLQRQLSSNVQDWLKSDRDTSFLVSGTRLAQLETLVSSPTVLLNQEEMSYLSASIAMRRRAANRVRMIFTVITVFSLVALALAAFAFQQQQEAQESEKQALSERDRADSQAAISRSRELAVTALNEINQYDLALLLSLEALKAADTSEARSSLFELLQMQPHLKTILYPPQDQVRSLALSPDGKLLAVGGRDNSISLWDTQTLERQGELLVGHKDWVNSLAFSPDGKWLASGGADNVVLVWDVASRQPVGAALQGHQEAVWSVAFNPAGTLLASAGADNQIILWDVATLTPIGLPLAGHRDIVYSVVFSPDGTRLASGSADQTILLWEVETGNAIGAPLTGHTNWVWSVAFSPDGRFLASGGADNTIRFWDATTGQTLGAPVQAHSGWVRQVKFSPDGQLLASASADRTLIVWSLTTGQPALPRLQAHQDAVWGIAFGADGKMLYSGGADSRIMVWDLNGQNLRSDTLNGHQRAVAAVAFSPDGKWLASGGGDPAGGGEDATVRLWDMATGGEAFILEGHQALVTAVAFSPQGDIVASGSADRRVILWDVTTGDPLTEALVEHQNSVFSVAFSPNGTLLASGDDDGRIILWNVEQSAPSGELIHTESGGVLALAFSPDGRTLVAGSRSGAILIWDVAQRHLIATLSAHTDAVTSLMFSQDGWLLASGSRDGTAILWDFAERRPLHSPLNARANWVLGVTFNPDGTLLATAHREQVIVLWDVETGRQIGQPLVAHQDWVNTALFDPEGNVVASGGRDGLIHLWRINPDDWRDIACQISRRNLSKAEWEQYFLGVAYHPTCAE